MTRVEREELLRRYLEGGMSLDQEHDFFIQVALDKELRHELRAQQTVDKAFQKDRIVDPSEYAVLQRNVSTMLAGMSPAVQSAGAAGASRLNTGIGHSGKWQAAGLLLIGMVAGVLGFVAMQSPEIGQANLPVERVQATGTPQSAEGETPAAEVRQPDNVGSGSVVSGAMNGAETSPAEFVSGMQGSGIETRSQSHSENRRREVGAPESFARSRERDPENALREVGPSLVSEREEPAVVSSREGAGQRDGRTEAVQPAGGLKSSEAGNDDSVDVGVRLLWNLP